MTFNKPKNMSYVDMAIYFDAHIKDDPRNDSLLYEYLYHLVYMLACKSRYFHKFEDYDQFALYAATKIYMRVIRNIKVKSILNYVKAVLYPMKVDYQKEAFNEILNPDVDKRINPDAIKSTMQDRIQADYSYGLSDALIEHMKLIPKYIRDVVNDTPYKDDALTSRRIYMSVLLTFLSSVTLSNLDIERLRRREEKGLDNDNNIVKLFNKERNKDVILWRLDSSMKDYISVLTIKVRKKFGQELMDVRKSFELSDDDLNAIMLSAYQTDNMKEGDID